MIFPNNGIVWSAGPKFCLICRPKVVESSEVVAAGLKNAVVILPRANEVDQQLLRRNLQLTGKEWSIGWLYNIKQ